MPLSYLLSLSVVLGNPITTAEITPSSSVQQMHDDLMAVTFEPPNRGAPGASRYPGGSR